jgi:RNA polymerase sigma-70 factor, ECF subfamily
VGRVLFQALDGHLGDAAAARTESLYRSYRADVTRICLALLRDRAEAEDAAQDVFLSAHRAQLRGVVPRDPAAWLATIARHECWARIRARMAAPTAVAFETETAASTDLVSGEEIEALWHAIAELPRAQREALLLREIRGLSYGQLARQLALTGPAVRSLLERARRRVRLRLRDVHAGLSGVPWLETLARLFIGGGGNPVAPVARAAALGLGAAAITGGMLATPSTFERHPHAPAARSAIAAKPHQARSTKTEAHAAMRVPPARLVDDHRGSEHHPAREHERARESNSGRDDRSSEAAVGTTSSNSGSGSSGDGGLSESDSSGEGGGDSHGSESSEGSEGSGSGH